MMFYRTYYNIELSNIKSKKDAYKYILRIYKKNFEKIKN